PEVPLDEQPTIGLLEEEPVGMGSVLLVALGVAGAGLFIAGMAVAFSSRRRPPGQPSVAGK
ncbi:MAG TPA: hypothetical protein VFK43_11865, partial [Acidimicrobiales bacterium]|nr:hypothetical protein [Acidimicrobiales bacterium]